MKCRCYFGGKVMHNNMFNYKTVSMHYFVAWVFCPCFDRLHKCIKVHHKLVCSLVPLAFPYMTIHNSDHTHIDLHPFIYISMFSLSQTHTSQSMCYFLHHHLTRLFYQCLNFGTCFVIPIFFFKLKIFLQEKLSTFWSKSSVKKVPVRQKQGSDDATTGW